MITIENNFFLFQYTFKCIFLNLTDCKQVLWMTSVNHESRESVCYIAAINMRIGNRSDSSSDITHALLLHSSTPFSVWFHSSPTGLFVVKSATLWLYAIPQSIWRPPFCSFLNVSIILTSSPASSLPLEVALKSPCLLAACFWLSLLLLCDKD